ncbi:efflux RND transporter periplasmic adaptor subunit [Singulisphaera sp. PoT]|uniref:efflux RND transporter periplasmic adaptor subunit n=1 Tax=Singulisphaera sp. PoT TaxID=3411797 RepID=UPI003BF4946E
MRVRGWAVTLGMLLSVVPLSGCGQEAAEPEAKANTAPKPVPVTVASLELRPLERVVEVVGSLKGWEDIPIGAKKEGRVLRVHHDMGDHIKPGELLVELDPIDADLTIRQRERQLQVELAKLGLKSLPQGDFDVSSVPTVVQARLSLDRARLNLGRERSLSRRNAGTTQDLQNAENDEQAAEAALANAILTANSNLASARASQVAVEVAKQARVDMEIHAPLLSKAPPGVTDRLTFALSRRSVSEGQMVRPGDPVVDLVIENPLRLWANVPERNSIDVQVEQPVRILVASQPGMTFEGKVTRINPSIDAASRTFKVEISVPNNRGLLRPGGFAKASILTKTGDKSKVVPLESVVKYAGVTKLFMVEGDKVRSINVETGLEGPGWVEVTGKLPDTGHVVTTGQTQLADGTLIVVRDPNEVKAENKVASEKAPAEEPKTR